MKIEEISQKPAIASNSGSDAYANAARSAWEKPTGAASVKSQSESVDPRPEQGTSKTDQLTPKSGNNESGADGEPGGGGSRPLENKDGRTATGSSAGEKAISADKKVPSPDGVSGEGNFAPADKLKVPMDNQGKANGEGSHSEKVAPKDKQDAAVQHLPSLSIV